VAKRLGALKSSQSGDPPVYLIYGNDGVGKTSLAAEFPSPIYIHTSGEETPVGIDLPAYSVRSYDDAIGIIEELLDGGHDFQTAIFDSVDGLEPLVWQKTCKRIGAATIEAPGYGKGYKEADEEWLFFLDGVIALKEAGMHVVMLAHPNAKTFKDPMSDPYDRYGIKVHERASALVREKSDVVGFMKQRVTLKEAKNNKGVVHGESGGDREIHLEERPGFHAKNRFNMPTKLTYKLGSGYADLSKFHPKPRGVAANDNGEASNSAQAA
jgi:hypothetical protein